MDSKEYEFLRNYVRKCSIQHGFTTEDCDDILHDALLVYYESDKELDIQKLIWKTIGKHRERRHREGKRQISMEYFKSKGEI